MAIASTTFIKTPATMMMNRCQAGLERNSQGWGGCFICSLSIDSSIMPEILLYPPNGTQPIPYSVESLLRQSSSGNVLRSMGLYSTSFLPSALRFSIVSYFSGVFLEKKRQLNLPFTRFTFNKLNPQSKNK